MERFEMGVVWTGVGAQNVLSPVMGRHDTSTTIAGKYMYAGSEFSIIPFNPLDFNILRFRCKAG